MTSTNMFSGLDNGAKPSSRVLRPPGGGSSNLFGGYEEDSTASRRPHKMASNLFSPPEPQEPQGVTKRTNPPGGKSSGIFDSPEVTSQQRKPVPPGGNASNIFGKPESTSPCVKAHSNKPQDNIAVGESATPKPEPPVSISTPQPKESPSEEVKEKLPSPPPTPTKAMPESLPAPLVQKPEASLSELSLKDHEPHLGPRPRSHNKVLNPPGGKSSVVFY